MSHLVNTLRERLTPALFAGAALASFALTLGQAEGSNVELGPDEAPILVELFTSQSCSSCPPAEAYFADLATDPSLVVIEWHVDYWNALVHGGDGSWVDPFSSEAHTERQRQYAQSLFGNNRVYTPQAIVAGAADAVGSDKSAVQRAIADAPAATARVSVDPIDDKLLATIEPRIGDETDADGADIVFVRLKPRQTTAVRGGENKDQVLSSANIALETVRLGEWTGRTAVFEAPAPSAGETCAIFVQTPEKILGAAYC
ncbi:MAG: DUF1223 domain-containing protein [Pseudomonadota bacterium]